MLTSSINIIIQARYTKLIGLSRIEIYKMYILIVDTLYIVVIGVIY
jgi:hypothetical protein